MQQMNVIAFTLTNLNAQMIIQDKFTVCQVIYCIFVLGIVMGIGFNFGCILYHYAYRLCLLIVRYIRKTSRKGR